MGAQETADRASSTPLGSLRNPYLGIHPDFPNSFSMLDFSHLAAWQTASLKGAMGTP
jgi:hypothetical protein